MSALGAQLAGVIVPPLREDLQLMPSPHSRAGTACLVYDPVAHRYHELPTLTLTLMSQWQAGMRLDTFAAHLNGLKAEPDIAYTPETLFEILTALDQAMLLAEPLKGWKGLLAKEEKKHKSIANWLLHNYLFFRLPLLNPDPFLARTVGHVARVCTAPLTLGVLAFLALSGMFLVSRQWDTFSHTFLHFLSLEGAAGYLLALGIVKLVHELGHGYMARYYGCRVPSMGLAFMVMAPVLYTDVTDAWRLQSRQQRLLIGAAGMLAETALAILATFLWALLPEGFLRSMCFFIATVSWIMTLAINLNPLMRFDGYYLLSDFWQIPNLQARAMALMRWWLREKLFALGEPCPEDWPPARRSTVIAYAVAVAIYRFFLFVGIALMVYHATFKVLGIILFAVEILWFIVLPIFTELKIWWGMREKILAQKHARRRLGLGAAFVFVLLIPLPNRVDLPAVLEPISAQRVAVAAPARLVDMQVKAGQHVVPGQILFQLESPRLMSEITNTHIQLELAELRYARRAATTLDRDAAQVVQQEISKFREKLAFLEQLREELVLRAKVPGIVTDVLPDLHLDRWLARGEELATIVADNGVQVRGYLPETVLGGVALGAEGVFVPDEPFAPSSKVRLASLAEGAVNALDLPYLASTYGGAIAVNEDREKGSMPVEAQYQAVLVPETAKKAIEDDGAVPQVLRGVVRLKAAPESALWRGIKRATSVLVRESGF